MKIRHGFVSNSSSSSFLVAAALTKDDKVLSKTYKVSDVLHLTHNDENIFVIKKDDDYDIVIKHEYYDVDADYKVYHNSIEDLNLDDDDDYERYPYSIIKDVVGKLIREGHEVDDCFLTYTSSTDDPYNGLTHESTIRSMIDNDLIAYHMDSEFHDN